MRRVQPGERPELRRHEALGQADTIAESIVEDLQTNQVIQLLNLLREDDVDEAEE